MDLKPLACGKATISVDAQRNAKAVLGQSTNVTFSNAGVDELSQTLSIMLDGRPVIVASGTTVAAAILQAGLRSRISMSGEARQPLCGMGICYECRAQVDGRAHERTCQI